MKGSWAQPSLSRDFALLSAAILFALFLVSAWVTYTAYTKHTAQVALELEKEAERVERTLSNEMESANYFLSALARQIILDNDHTNLTRLAQMLKSFDSKGYIYSILSWIGPDGHLLVSSNRGVLDEPVDTSDRDYVQKAMAEPWKMHIGRPIEGRVSERWVIPVAMGVTDYTGKFIGTIQISIDINSLTERLSNLVKRDGISFAIVSKSLIPLTEVSDDKDFVTNNFPTQKLVNVNFSENPSGLITQGSLFWGTGSYSYYRVSTDYPYIILLGYDSRYSDESVRGMLWSRLLQMLLMAVFLVSFLWIMRVRMIKPVLDMTAIATAVAKGEAYKPLPTGGPVEIEGLSTQVRRIGDYIKETKRIEEELRNKMFLMKKTKERAEIDKRSKSEFLAHICQEMRSPLNNIIGFAQVMRDQLYGPIENRKYRQYAADIYQTGNTLLNTLQELLTLSKIETGYLALAEKPVDVAAVIDKVKRFAADKMQGSQVEVNVRLAEPLPRLVADEFQLQQIIMNILLYALEHMSGGQALTIDARAVTENKEHGFFALHFATDGTPPSAAELIARAEKTMHTPASYPSPENDAPQSSLSLELARLLIGLHHGFLDIAAASDDKVDIAIFFAGNRIRFLENQETD